MDLSRSTFDAAWLRPQRFKQKKSIHVAWILPICPKPPPKVKDCVMPGASKRWGCLGFLLCLFFVFDSSSNTIEDPPSYAVLEVHLLNLSGQPAQRSTKPKDPFVIWRFTKILE